MNFPDLNIINFEQIPQPLYSFHCPFWTVKYQAVCHKSKKTNLLIKYQPYAKLNLLIKYQLYRKPFDIISTIYKTKNPILSLQYHHDAMLFTPKKLVGIYLLNVNNENNITWSTMYWKFNCHIKVVMMFLLLILNKCQNLSIVFNVNIEQLNTRLLM